MFQRLGRAHVEPAPTREAAAPWPPGQLAAVPASRGGGELYVDTLKSKRARTVPLVPELVPTIDRWAKGKAPGDWLFAAPEGGPLR
jgi:integrase